MELARAIRRLPSGLVLVCVEAERFDHGAPLSEAVAVAVPAAVAAVVAAIEQLELTTEDALPATEWLRSAGEERTGEG